MHLVAAAAISISSYHSARATVYAIYPKLIPFSTIWNVFGKWALLITVTLKDLTLLTKTSSRMATILPTRLTIFRRCYNGTYASFIPSQKSLFYSILLIPITFQGRQIFAESFSKIQQMITGFDTSC
jgi:hypothetical protein